MNLLTYKQIKIELYPALTSDPMLNASLYPFNIAAPFAMADGLFK